MARVAGQIRQLHAIQTRIRAAGEDGFLLLTDLADSTGYKGRNGEDAWLPRLFDFYDAVKRGLTPHAPCKYLGDGILTFVRQADVDGAGLLEIAKRVHQAVEETNCARSYRGEHRLRIRTVLGGGRVHMYDRRDPQGTPVDALFRMEKFVPIDCIGLLEIAARGAQDLAVYIGAYRVKGLTDHPQRLWLLRQDLNHQADAIEAARVIANLHDVWDMGKNADGRIVIINGYVPELAGAPASIQLGDIRAEQLVYANLVRIGRGSDIMPLTTRDHEEKHLRENVICLGGPYWNAATRRFMQELHLPLRFDLSAPDDRTPLLDELSGKTFHSAWIDGCVCRDYGLFVRAKNPYNPSRHVILAAGIETYAVGGVVEAFGPDNPAFSDLCAAARSSAIDTQSSFPDFYCVLPFTVERSGKASLPGSAEQRQSLVRAWDRDGNWPLQESPIA
jgi:hypothetical protein